MPNDLRPQLEAFQQFAEAALKDLDRLSHEQREVIAAIVARIDHEKVERIQKDLGTS